MGSNHQGRLWEGGGTLAGPQSWGWEDISVCENGAEHGLFLVQEEGGQLSGMHILWGK